MSFESHARLIFIISQSLQIHDRLRNLYYGFKGLKKAVESNRRTLCKHDSHILINF
jgi:hypothetical protein